MQEIYSVYGNAVNRQRELKARTDYYPTIQETIYNVTNALEGMKKDYHWVEERHFDAIETALKNVTDHM